MSEWMFAHFGRIHIAPAYITGRRGLQRRQPIAADVVAVSGDLLHDIGMLEKMVFVMKDGNVYKNQLRLVQGLA